jgi:hypothetical protein
VIEPSEKLGYWVGVAQSDGCLRRYLEKRRNVTRFIVSLEVAKLSLPMIYKFQEISNEVFNRSVSVFKENRRDVWVFNIRVNSLMKTFQYLELKFGDPPTPPKWSITTTVLFGSYMAGLIDGDGDVRIKRKKYPQCVVRISSGGRQGDLSAAITKTMNCSVSITSTKRDKEIGGRKFRGLTYSLEFYVSSKNYEFIKDFILPFITIKYKKEKLKSYIESKWPQWRSQS